MPETVIDFSENVNPLGPPSFVKEQWTSYLNLITTYPDPLGEPFLTASANYHGVEKEKVLIGNGAAEIFACLASRYQNKRALIIHPTFSEYEATLSPYNVTIKEIIALQEFPLEKVLQEMENSDVLYICRPNNPTGYLYPLERIIQLAKYAKKYSCEIILDEAFLDFIDEKESFIPFLEDYPHVVVVRSMTKMYAIPGLRLGYVIAQEEIIKELRRKLPHWNSNSLALHIGADCLKEEAYRRKTIDYASSGREDLVEFLEQWNCRVLPSQTNFLCFQLSDPTKSESFFRYLLRKGCVLRHSENFKGLDGKWFRVGKKKRERMDLLKKEMTAWFEENLSS